jgi:hypothetical protein
VITPRLVLDTGGLLALERNDARAFAQLTEASRRGYLVVVPAFVILEAYAGTANMARLNQVMKAIDMELALTPAVARKIPAVRKRAGVDSDADVHVVLEALDVTGSHILTSDPKDIFAVVAACDADGRVQVHTI